MQIQEIGWLPESKVRYPPPVPGFSEVIPAGFDYQFLYAGFWGHAKENPNFNLNTDMTVYRTIAPSLLIQIPSSKTIELGQKAYWLIGIWHSIPNSYIRFDFWHRDSRAAPAGIWGKRIYYWRYDQAVMTQAWSVDAGTDPANTWIQVTNVAIPTGVSTYLCVYFSLEALTGITNAAINVYYDDIRMYT